MPVLTDAQVYLDHLNLSGFSNTVTLSLSSETKDSTTFASSGNREFTLGLTSGSVAVEGFVDYAEPGESLFAESGASGFWTIAERSTAVSGLAPNAWLGQFQNSDYGVPMTVGELATYSMSGTANGTIGAGRLLLPATEVTSTGSVGLVGQIPGGAASGETLQLTVHVIAAGTTVTVDVESSAVSGMTTPTTEISETVTTVGGSLFTAAGPITNEFFQINVSAITGTFTLAAGLAVV